MSNPKRNASERNRRRKDEQKSMGKRLKALQERLGLNQNEFAAHLGMPIGSYSGLINQNEGILHISDFKHLLSATDKDGNHLVTLRDVLNVMGVSTDVPDPQWHSHIPNYVIHNSNKEATSISDGQFNRRWKSAQQSIALLDSLTRWQSSENWSRIVQSEHEDKLYSIYQTAVRSSLAQINFVRRDNDLENALNQHQAYQGKLKAVYVARTRPYYSETKTRQYYDCLPLRIDLVTALAAQNVVADLSHKQIALSGGYTMMRFAEQLFVDNQNMKNITWIPLVAIPRQGYKGDNSYVTSPIYSANFIATYLKNRFRYSEALWLPYRKYDNTDSSNHNNTAEFTPPEDDYDAGELVKQEVKNATYAFITVSGKELNIKGNERANFRQGSDDDGREHLKAPLFIRHNDDDSIVGEVIGYPIQNTGKLVRDISAESRKSSRRLPLDTLQTIGSKGYVYVLAAGAYKARAVDAMIQGGHANCLVIDSELAQQLLHSPNI